MPVYLTYDIKEEKKAIELPMKYLQAFFNFYPYSLYRIISIDKEIINFDQLTTSRYSFYENPFPLVFAMKIKETTEHLIINIRLRYNVSNKVNYNFTNLIFKSFYTDKESFDNYKGNYIEMKILKELNLISFPEQPIINREENDFSNISQYDYLIITIEENKRETNWIYPNLEFDISPYVSYNFNDTIFITERKYHYNKLQSRNTKFNAYQLYYLESFSPFVYIEIASCSSDSYLISFTDKYGEALTSFTKSIFNGKINIIVNNKAQIPIVLNLTLNSKEKEAHYHVIKYNNKNSNAESPLNYKFKNLTTKYDPNDITITSSLGEINDANERDSTIISVFYYYLYINRNIQFALWLLL